MISSHGISAQKPLYRPSYATNKQYSFPAFKPENIVQETPEEQAAKFLAKCGKCNDCGEHVPHKLLYVCRHKKCKGFYEPKGIKYDEPAKFYENEKVFCSKCTFTGSHRRHSDEMEEAHPIVTKIASGNEDLHLKFEMIAFLDQEDPVDYSITTDFKVPQLPVLQVEKYLLNAEDSTDWHQRKKEIDGLKKTVDQCRLEGSNFARECAEKALNTYFGLLKTVNEALKIEETEEKEGGDFKAGTSGSSDNKDEESEVDETTAKMICRNLNLHFEQIRDAMKIEAALQEVSDKLHEATGTRDNKLAAARMFKEYNNVALYYPPQN